ncbi:9508_t:CDS:2 [Paraglomus brasilianum]|uniref:9508_t:CDS:1 n=1 Tax=Paraglomus brasilianum TaxID=144538 RepID=A0A9N8ZRA0_9GLOM|nr:9508_t:CDS:2 [Paraglomus brasilianum]
MFRFVICRKHDYENYLISAFYPKEARPAHVAVRAFNLEIAMVRENVSNPHIGSMRMQFWRETIDGVFKGNPPRHPIALILSDVLKRSRLSPLFFKRVIDERALHLSDLPCMTIKDLESYGENTSSCLLYLHLESLGIRDLQADHAASHIGKAIGIASVLRAFPYLASKRRMMVPVDVLAKYNISQEEVFRSGRVEGLADAIFEVATTAHDHLITARSFLPRVPKQAISVLLPAVSCESYLKRLEKYNFDVFEPKLSIQDWKLPFTLWISHRKQRY